MTTHSCGCVTAVHAPSGVTQSISKCQFHVDFLANQRGGEWYYRHIGVLDDAGEVRRAEYCAQMEAALGQPFPPPVPVVAGRRLAEAIEVGCGVSPYVHAVKAAGYRYTGVEPDEWGATRTVIEGADSMFAEKFDGSVFAADTFGLVLSAHCVEHVEDAPGMLRQFHRILAPGGRLVLLVPDDEDMTNPDHRWFFTPATLVRALVAAGFEVQKLAPRRVVAHELFLFVLAHKREVP